MSYAKKKKRYLITRHVIVLALIDYRSEISGEMFTLCPSHSRSQWLYCLHIYLRRFLIISVQHFQVIMQAIQL